MEYDEVAQSLRRYRQQHPNPNPADVGPVTSFPRLPAPEELDRLPQWVAHVRSMARMWEYPADDAEILAFEAQTYLRRHTRPCVAGRIEHRWVDVYPTGQPSYTSCAWCGGHLGERP